MTINVRQTAPTQYLSANSANQQLTFASTGTLLVTAVGDTCFVATGSDNTVTADTGIPVLSNVQVLLQTGQSFNQDPGPVYFVCLTNGGVTDVFVTPVETN
jgi:archaellum component FlaG (FlaF/FlaG flagellin family)